MVVLTLKTISHCLLDLEKNWNIQIKHLQNSLKSAEDEIVTLKAQLETKEKLLKSYEDRKTETLSHQGLSSLQNHGPARNFYQRIIIPQTSKISRSTSHQTHQIMVMDKVKTDNTMDVKQEPDDVAVILVTPPEAPIQSIAKPSVEVPMVESPGVPESLNKTKKRPRIENEHNDEIPLDVIVRESHQQKQKCLNISTVNTIRQLSLGPSTSGAFQTSEPSGQRNYRQLMPKFLGPKNASNTATAVVLTHHTSRSESPINAFPPQPIMLDLKCTICMVRCQNIQDYRNHHKIAHPKSKQILCQLCPYATINKMNFDHHMQTHDEYVSHPGAQKGFQIDASSMALSTNTIDAPRVQVLDSKTISRSETDIEASI